MSTTYPRVLLSVTSVPQRFDNSLREVVSKLQETGETVVVCLPTHYRKWGRAPTPDYLTNYSNIVLFQPSKDYGPATKLLGALEYIHGAKDTFDAIVTLDDDLYYADTSAAITYLKQQSLQRPGCVITIGGLKLGHFPYRPKNGVYGNNVGYVDAVAGFRGVYYPLDKIKHDRRIFDFVSEFPEGIFNDDDAYFGICLSRMEVPIFAVKPPKRNSDRVAVTLVSAQGAGGSAVQEKAEMNRIDNAMRIFQFAVSKGWLPSRMAMDNPDSLLRKLLNRSKLGRKLLRWQFNW
jgi:glycosyltransferase involved in cell wall biosynthesis